MVKTERAMRIPIGSILYAIGAVYFAKFLLEQKEKLEQSVDKVWLNLYIASLGLGCVSFMYFHIACGGLIQHFKVLYEVTGGDVQMATDAWMKMLMPELLPMSFMFIGFDGRYLGYALVEFIDDIK